MGAAVLLLVAGAASSAAFCTSPADAAGLTTWGTDAALMSLHKQAKAAFSSVLCSAIIFAVTPAVQAQPATVEQAIVEYAEASIPILRSLQPEELTRFSSKAAELALSAKPEELSRAVDLGLDAFLAVPAEKLTATQGVLVAAYADVALASCDRVPLPSADVRERVAGAMSRTADPAKLKTVNQYTLAAIKAIPHDGDAFCLPPATALGKVALAGADAAAAAEPTKLKAFQEQAQLALKSVPKVTAVKVLPELQLRAKMFGELPDRQRLKAARSSLDAAQAAETARRKAASFPTKCYTMSCYTYPNDLGAGRAMMEFAPELALYDYDKKAK